MSTSVSSLLDISLAMFYQSLTQGEIPNVNRLAPNPKNWPEFLAQVKGQTLDRYSLFTQDPDGDQKANDAISFRTRGCVSFEVLFQKVEGSWVLYRIDWYRSPANAYSVDHCF